jgi:hypothetical protein
MHRQRLNHQTAALVPAMEGMVKSGREKRPRQDRERRLLSADRTPTSIELRPIGLRGARATPAKIA